MRAKPERTQRYAVSLRRESELHAVAEAHGHTLRLGVHRGDPEAGFNAAETLMAAFGACLMTNINSLAEKMRLQIDDARIEIRAGGSLRRTALIALEYELVLTSPEPEEKLEKLHQQAVKWGTVANTLSHGITPRGTIRVEWPPFPPPRKDT